MPAITTYQQRLTAASSRRHTAHRRWSMLGNLRLLAAGVLVITAWQLWRDASVAWIGVLVVGAVGFILLAVQQRLARNLRDDADRMVLVNQRALDRLALQWNALPLPPEADIDRTHPYAYDLNIVGWGGLTQRIGTPVTRHGWDALHSLLLHETDPVTVPARADAVRELAQQLDLRQSIEAIGLRDDSIPDAAALVAWASQPPWLHTRVYLRALAFIGPLLLLASIVLTLATSAPWVIVLPPIALNTLVFTLLGATAARLVRQMEPMRAAVTSYENVTRLIAAGTPASPAARDLHDQLHGAATALAALSRRLNLVLPAGSMLYFPLQMTTMWDIHLLHALEGWRGRHGSHLTGWLQAMGEWEALAALAVLAHDHPEWCMPDIDPSLDGVHATQLAHPLLAAEVAVANDASISPRGAFLFVTGSNMSGKSTLLRAIGINVVLAQAGAPVCAQSLTMPPLRLSSCMRVEDSLAHGVSFFMAELQRLKAVVDAVQASSDRMSLYLLDEILQGTNTAERQIASRRVLAQLCQQWAIGAVSSHDLELISGTGLEQHAILVHFAEQFRRVDGKPDMRFDYVLRPGIATSSNAIRLMELLGFDMQE